MDSEAVDPGNLPLVVWLKGHESYFEHFSMDADQVMKQLGIKRSRLRQISGQELRVGRKRIDRYVRPVYRPEDVESYLNWTRATASHKKSSGLLQQAVEDLSGLSGQIQETFSRDILTTLSRVEEHILRLGKYSAILLEEQKDDLVNCLNPGLEALKEDFAIQSRATNELKAILQNLGERLGSLHIALEISQSNLIESGQTGEANLRTSLDSQERIRQLQSILQDIQTAQTGQTATLNSLSRSCQTKKAYRTGRLAARQLQRRENRPANKIQGKKEVPTQRPWKTRLTTRFI